jgi:hypothetical protein
MRASRASSKAAAKDIHSDTKKTTTYLHAAKQFPFRTIVAAVDFSEESSAALRCAQELARLRHAMLLLIHVIDPVGYAFPAGAPAVGITTMPRGKSWRGLRRRCGAGIPGAFAGGNGDCVRADSAVAAGSQSGAAGAGHEGDHRSGARSAGPGDAPAAGAFALPDPDCAPDEAEGAEEVWTMEQCAGGDGLFSRLR